MPFLTYVVLFWFWSVIAFIIRVLGVYQLGIPCVAACNVYLRLPPRYQLIWTIYIPFKSPWLIDFRNTRCDSKFWRCVMPCGVTLCKLVFSGGIAAWEQRHTRKIIRLKIFHKLLFYQFISKLFASRSTLCHLSMTQRSWENLDYIKFRSTFVVSSADNMIYMCAFCMT